MEYFWIPNPKAAEFQPQYFVYAQRSQPLLHSANNTTQQLLEHTDSADNTARPEWDSLTHEPLIVDGTRNWGSNTSESDEYASHEQHHEEQFWEPQPLDFLAPENLAFDEYYAPQYLNFSYRQTNNVPRAQIAVEEFSAYFGKDVMNLYNLQKLCWTCGVEEQDIPGSIHGCKRALRAVHVNIFDLVAAGAAGTRVDTFSSHQELLMYSEAMQKVRPLWVGKGNALFKAVLRRFR